MLVDHHAVLAGSSPRAGRRRSREACRCRHEGLIPASGETTTTRATSSCSATAHPRERGDDFARAVRNSSTTGSSPRAGRRRVGVAQGHAPPGLIPASGETTLAASVFFNASGAHPRERGDDRLGLLDEVVPQGSSPRAGRRRLGHLVGREEGGLIPASGETTRLRSPTTGARGAHPRERGDDDIHSTTDQKASGSSPRAGRRQRPSRRRDAHRGLIPASGETTECLGLTWGCVDGSSPRAGRRPRLHHGRDGGGGLIPASGETTRRFR